MRLYVLSSRQLFLDNLFEDRIHFQKINFSAFSEHFQKSILEIGISDIRIADFSQATASIGKSEKESSRPFEKVIQNSKKFVFSRGVMRSDDSNLRFLHGQNRVVCDGLFLQVKIEDR